MMLEVVLEAEFERPLVSKDDIYIGEFDFVSSDGISNFSVEFNLIEAKIEKVSGKLRVTLWCEEMSLENTEEGNVEYDVPHEMLTNDFLKDATLLDVMNEISVNSDNDVIEAEAVEWNWFNE